MHIVPLIASFLLPAVLVASSPLAATPEDSSLDPRKYRKLESEVQRIKAGFLADERPRRSCNGHRKRHHNRPNRSALPIDVRPQKRDGTDLSESTLPLPYLDISESDTFLLVMYIDAKGV